MNLPPKVQSCGDPGIFAHDLNDEGEPEPEFNVGIAHRLPRKNVASGALIRHPDGRILFVVPTYKPFLEIPGGLAEDDESPLAACRREVQEELGLELPISRLLLIDWMPTHGVWRDSIQMIFDGGTLTLEQIGQIQLPQDELGGIKFLSLGEAKAQLRPSLARRVEFASNAIEQDSPQYGEFGRRV